MTLRDDSSQASDVHILEDFEQLTRPHIDALWSCAYRMTGSRETADDLTQDACFKAFKSMGKYQQGTNYRAWILKILVNLCRDYIRRESRAPFKLWDDQQVESALAETDNRERQPDMQLQQSAFYADALEAVSQLSPDVRLVVSLSLFNGMSYQEIADIAGVPIGTVRSRLSRGRKRLQENLKMYVTDEIHELQGKQDSGSTLRRSECQGKSAQQISAQKNGTRIQSENSEVVVAEQIQNS